MPFDTKTVDPTHQIIHLVLVERPPEDGTLVLHYVGVFNMVYECILFSASAGYCNDRNNMHGVNNIKFVNFHYFSRHGVFFFVKGPAAEAMEAPQP